MTVPTPETLVREVFTAFAEHDLASLQILLAPGFVLHVPEHLPCSGSYRGWAEVGRFYKAMARQGKSALQPRIGGVLAGSEYAAVLGTEANEARVVYVLRLEEGRVAECWMHT